MTLETLGEVVADWRTGEVRWRDVYPIFLDLLASAEVGEILSRLPSDLRQRFEDALRLDFDSDVPDAAVIWIDNARGDHPAKRLIVERARKWINAHRSVRDS